MKKMVVIVFVLCITLIFAGCSKTATAETCPITTGSVSCGADTGAVTP